MRALGAVLLAAGIALAAGRASAGPIGGEPPDLHVSATSGDGSAHVDVFVPGVPNGDGTYTASSSAETSHLLVDFDLSLNPDPDIHGSFTLTNKDFAELTFTVIFALPLSSVPGAGSASGYFGPTTYTDAGQSNSVDFRTNDPTPFYAAVLAGTRLRGLGAFELNAFGGPGVFGTISRQDWSGSLPPGLPSPGTLEVQFNGTISDRDSVRVEFGFTVVPEPALAPLAALAAVGLALLRRARA